MASNNEALSAEITAESRENPENLIHLDQKSDVPSPGKDLNAKLQLLQENLGKLAEDLKNTDSDLHDLHSHTSSQDEQLEGQIKETHQSLTVVQSSYEDLSKRADALNSETSALQQRLVEQGEDISTRLIAERDQTVSELEAVKASMDESMVEQRQALEQRINGLADKTEQRQAELQQQQDTQLQQIGQLEVKTQQLAESLESRVTALQATIDSVEERLAAELARLAYESKLHTRLIAQLFEMANRHRTFGIVASLIFLMVAGGLFYMDHLQSQKSQIQQTMLEQAGEKMANDVEALENQIAATAAAQSNEIAIANAETRSEMEARLQQQQQTIAALQVENEAVQQKLQTVQDKSDSANGRLNAMHPLYQFGKDSVIHGPEWLAAQSSESYVIVLAQVSDQNELYKLADRNSYYLTENLSYLLNDGATGQSYSLVYGPFADEIHASRALFQMPPVDSRSQGKVVRLGDLLGSR